MGFTFCQPPKNVLTKISHPKKVTTKFKTQKSPQIEHFKPKKGLCTSSSLIYLSTPLGNTLVIQCMGSGIGCMGQKKELFFPLPHQKKEQPKQVKENLATGEPGQDGDLQEGKDNVKYGTAALTPHSTSPSPPPPPPHHLISTTPYPTLSIVLFVVVVFFFVVGFLGFLFLPLVSFSGKC